MYTFIHLEGSCVNAMSMLNDQHYIKPKNFPKDGNRIGFKSMTHSHLYLDQLSFNKYNLMPKIFSKG